MARRIVGASSRLLRLAGAPIAARPLASAGIAAFAALFAIVAANALHGQPGRHHKPMIATRGPFAETPDGPVENDTALMPVPLVREVQTALLETGHYQGAIDGRPGRATEAAIRAFQSDNGLKVDGEASPRLLAQIRQMTAQLQNEAPTPLAAPSPNPQRQASLDARTGSAPGPANEARSNVPKPMPAPLPAPLPPQADAEIVRRIQSGLVTAKIATLHPDGILGEQTRTAIRTFEALQGFDVTGRPDPRILKRLIAIGAVK